MEIDARIIDKKLGNSFKVGKYDLYDEIVEKNFSLWKFYSADSPDKVNMSVLAGKPEYFENVITKIHADIPVQALDIISDPEVSGEYAPYTLAYRIENSHNAYININHPEKDIAVIEDINNNFILIEIYDKNSHLDIFNIVANFECFEADGYRFINSEYRDGIYVDDIVKVTERK